MSEHDDGIPVADDKLRPRPPAAYPPPVADARSAEEVPGSGIGGFRWEDREPAELPGSELPRRPAPGAGGSAYSYKPAPERRPRRPKREKKPSDNAATLAGVVFVLVAVIFAIWTSAKPNVPLYATTFTLGGLFHLLVAAFLLGVVSLAVIRYWEMRLLRDRDPSWFGKETVTDTDRPRYPRVPPGR